MHNKTLVREESAINLPHEIINIIYISWYVFCCCGVTLEAHNYTVSYNWIRKIKNEMYGKISRINYRVWNISSRYWDTLG